MQIRFKTAIEEQGKLDDSLKAQILAADTKTRLEDLYLPYKPKRRTKGQIAIEAGLLALAESLLADPGLDPEQEAARYIVGGDAQRLIGLAADCSPAARVEEVVRHRVLKARSPD